MADERKVLRIIAKIAYGLACLKVGSEVMNRDPWPHLRFFVIGEDHDELRAPVRAIHEPGVITDWPDHHLAVVQPWLSGLRGIVSLFGGCHVVQFDPSPEPVVREPLVAISRRSGREPRSVEGDDAAAILQLLEGRTGALLVDNVGTTKV